MRFVTSILIGQTSGKDLLLQLVDLRSISEVLENIKTAGILAH